MKKRINHPFTNEILNRNCVFGSNGFRSMQYRMVLIFFLKSNRPKSLCAHIKTAIKSSIWKVNYEAMRYDTFITIQFFHVTTWLWLCVCVYVTVTFSIAWKSYHFTGFETIQGRFRIAPNVDRVMEVSDSLFFCCKNCNFYTLRKEFNFKETYNPTNHNNQSKHAGKLCYDIVLLPINIMWKSIF